MTADRVTATARAVAYWRHAQAHAATVQDRRIAAGELARVRREHQAALADIYSAADEWSARRHLTERTGI